jgi:hypothetical protein
MKKLWFFIGLLVTALETVAAPWHYPLYLDHNIPHKQRRAIMITNKSDAASDGDMMFISVKELGLAGTPSKDIRVVDDKGMELMFAIQPERPTLTEDGNIIVPVKADAGQTVTLWLYWDKISQRMMPQRAKPHLLKILLLTVGKFLGSHKKDLLLPVLT